MDVTRQLRTLEQAANQVPRSGARYREFLAKCARQNIDLRAWSKRIAALENKLGIKTYHAFEVVTESSFILQVTLDRKHLESVLKHTLKTLHEETERYEVGTCIGTDVEDALNAIREGQLKPTGKMPPNCPHCNGETEWTDGLEVRINCHFCGLSDYQVG